MLSGKGLNWSTSKYQNNKKITVTPRPKFATVIEYQEAKTT